MPTTDNIAYGAWTELATTGLVSLAHDAADPFGAWQSARIDNQTSVKAIDFEVLIHLATAATAPAGDSALYVYVIPWIYDGSSWWYGANFGTTTYPTGTDAAASISDPNSMKGPYAIPYKITSQTLDGVLSIAQMCGGVVPDGWSLAIRNCTGAALLDDSTPNTELFIGYRAITFTNT